MLPAAAFSQTSSINTYSPYSFYGLGDMSIQGSAAMRAMGGAGIAVRDYTSVNYLNPASYSAVANKSVLFGVGMEGQNFYLSDGGDRETSYNTFNIRDLALQLPLTKGLGAAISVTPYSSVGYRMQSFSDLGAEVTEIGSISRYYSGAGGLSQVKFGVGWELWQSRLSIGVEGVYYHGNLERGYSLSFEPIVTTGTYISLSGSQTEKINRLKANFGLQAMLIRTNEKILSLGLVYRMGGDLKGEVNEYIPHAPEGISAVALGVADAIRNTSAHSGRKMPHIVTAGVHFAKTKYSIAADYTFSSWGSSNKDINTSRAAYRNTNTFAGGVEFTPNPMDPRNYLRRCTYRFGVRYSDYYMEFDMDNTGMRSLSDKTITAGIGFPLDPRRRNFIDVGLEAGMRGTTKHNLIKENYFKFSIGFRFFGDDYWFQKYKYN